MIGKFENLKAWNLGIDLAEEIYKTTSKGNFAKDFGLRDQIQRAAVSIILNIAEGFDSGSPKYFLQFLRYSYRSASEVKAIVYLSLRLKYIDDQSFRIFISMIEEFQKVTAGLIKSQILRSK